MPASRLVLLTLAAWGAFAPVAVAQPAPLRLSGALEPGDEVCTNLCDRYGMIWDGGGPIRVRLSTNGFPGEIRATQPNGARPIGGGTELSLVATAGTPIFLEVAEGTPTGGGLYQLQIEPAPSRYRLPGTRSMTSAQPSLLGPVAQPAFQGPPAPPRAPVRHAAGTPSPADPTRETVERLMRGFRAATPLMVGRLEQVPSLAFAAKRGRCYRSAIILAPGARRRQMSAQSPAPAALVRMTLRTARGPEAVTETAHSTDRVIALDDDLCAPEDGRIEIAFLDRLRADTVSSPGLGPFTVQLFER